MNPITLPTNTIDVWYAWLSQPAYRLSTLERVLSLEERYNASRYQQLAIRQRAVASRGLLRMLLSAYLRCTPGEIPLVLAGRKPIIERSVNPGLEFSVAHTRSLVAFAIARCPVGIDVASTNSGVPGRQIAAHAFSPVEFNTLLGLPAEEVDQAALCAWTAKEAIYKAVGEAELRLQDIEVAVGADSPSLIRLGEVVQWQPAWQLVELSPTPLHIATLCFPASASSTIREQWIPREEMSA
jgi:4'-phosphopantetheinyl transferase